jgi:hypothetical protein
MDRVALVLGWLVIGTGIGTVVVWSLTMVAVWTVQRLGIWRDFMQALVIVRARQRGEWPPANIPGARTPHDSEAAPRDHDRIEARLKAICETIPECVSEEP